MLGIFIVFLKPGFVILLKNACISANKGRNGRQIVRGNWHSLQHVTVLLSWSGKLLASLFFSCQIWWAWGFDLPVRSQ